MNATDAILGPTLETGGAARIALRTLDRTVTYGALDALVNRIGNGLLALDIRRESRVLLLLKDSPELVASYLGTMRIGAVAVALNVRLSASDLLFAIEDSRCALLVVDVEFLPTLLAIRDQVADLPAILVVGGGAGEFTDFATYVAAQSPALVSAAMSPDDMAFWIYTSGTTGTPKAAVHLQHDVLDSDRYLTEALGLGPDDRLFATSKLFFAYALGTCLFGALRIGAESILLADWPDCAAIARVMQTCRPTALFSVPTLYRNMLRDGIATPAVFQSMRVCASAGERLPVSLHDRWREATGLAIVDGMGTSETIYMILTNKVGELKPGSAGRPAAFARAELRDETGRVVDTPGMPGVLWASMASTCDRYWNQQTRSHAAFAGAWFRTGDIFTVDADGWWFHEGRADDMLKISGQWVSPAEIEEEVLRLPQIADAAVVAVANDDGLTRLSLFVVQAADTAIDAEAIRAALITTLSVYKCPRDIRFVTEVPRTATGKIQRFRLRDVAASNQDDAA